MARPAPPPPPAAPGALGSITSACLLEFDRAAAAEKAEWVQKLRTLQQDPAGKSKWVTFCKVHGEGKTDVNHHDMAFLLTFFESYENGSIADDLIAGEAAGPAGASATPAADGKVFVGGLPKGTKEDALWTYFGQWGSVAKVELKMDEFGQPRGFAFVTFQDPAHAQQVIDNKDYNKMEGKWIDCKLAQGQEKGGKGGSGKDKGGKGGDDADGTKVFVGGLPKTVTEASFNSFFSYYGSIARAELKFDDAGVCKGFGFVTFTSADIAAKVLANPSVEFEGKWIECKAVNPRGEKGSDKDGGKGKEKGGKDKSGSASGWSAGGDWSAPASGGEWKSGGGGGDWKAAEPSTGGAWSSGGADSWGSSGGNGGATSGGGSDSWGPSDGSGAGSAGASGGYGAAQTGNSAAGWGPY